MAINTTAALGNVDWGNMILGVPGIAGLVSIGKAVGIAVIVYIAFLIIRSIVQIKYSLRIKKISQNVEEINKKMDVLIGKKKK